MAKYKTISTLSVAAIAMGAFASLPTAVMAGSDLSTITDDLTLTKSVTMCYTVANTGKAITIDLNGHGITCADGSAITVEKGATVTIKGTGNVVSNKNGAAVLNKGGDVTIESGTYRADNWYTIKNLGTMVINDGAFGGTEHKADSSLVDNGWYKGDSITGHPNDKGVVHAEDEIATLTINGGTFTHLNTTSTIKSDDYSKTTINNGTFESKQGHLVQATGDVTINDGKFTGYSSMIAFNGDGSDACPGKAEINGGTVNAKYIAESWWDNATLKITGGTFSGLESIVKGRTETFNGEGITGGSFNIAPDALIAENSECDEDHNVVSKVVDYKGKTEKSDSTKAGENEQPVEGTVKFNGEAEIDRKGYFLILDHGTDGLEMKETSGETSLVAAYDLNMYDRDGVIVPVNDTEMMVQVVLTEDQYNKLKEYDKVKAVYFDEDGNEGEERIDVKLDAEGRLYFATFTVTHFSTYGLVGMNAEVELDTDETEETATAPETGTMTATGASAASAGILAAATAVVMSVIAGIAMLVKRK